MASAYELLAELSLTDRAKILEPELTKLMELMKEIEGE